jgi:ABC-type Na+ efflux pump permease subunit
MLTCKRLRSAVIVSALLLVAGLVLETVAQVTGFAVPTSHLALFAVLGAAGVLGITFLASLLPVNARRLRECQH